jgi:multidrug resistance protein, MATE family
MTQFHLATASADQPETRFRIHVQQVAQLAWPIVLGQLAVISMNLVDTVVAGRLSAQVLAEVALGTALWGPFQLLLLGVSMALSPEIAQRRGAQEQHAFLQSGESQLSAVLARGVALNLLLCAATLPLLLVLAPVLLRSMQIEPGLAGGAMRFLYGIAPGGPALALNFVLLKFCEGMGRTRPSLYSGACGLLLLIPLANLFVHGGYGVPQLAAYGCGLATALVLYCNSALLLAYVWIQFADLGALRHWPRWALAPVLSLAALGLPIAVTILMEAGLFYAALLLMTRFGADWVAAHAVALNVAGLAFMLPLGIANAVTVQSGVALGRGQPREALRVFYAGALLMLVTQALSALLMLGFAREIAELYLPGELQVAALAVNLLLLAALFQVPDGVQVLFAGALRGLKDTRWPMLLTTISYWCVGFVCAYVLAFRWQWGPQGLWLGLTLGLMAAAVLLGLRYLLLMRVTLQRAIATSRE